jgi:hypothetical protein
MADSFAIAGNDQLTRRLAAPVAASLITDPDRRLQAFGKMPRWIKSFSQ